MPRIDLQAHSLHSDGELAVGDLVAAAAAAGVELLALSDHDTVDGVEEAREATAAHGIGLLPATEISAVDAGYEDLHILGYAIDHHDRLLLERLGDARADRAAQLGLLRSASSDFHGPHHRLFSRFLAYQLHGRTPELGPLTGDA